MNSSKRKFIYIIALLTVAMLFFASGCSQSSGENESIVSIVLIPSQAMVMVNASIAFNVTILGTNLADLTWYVNDLEGGSSELGFVQNGVYTAPPLQPTNPTLQIICRSKTDPNAAATATIRITTPWVKTFGGLNDEVFSAVQEDSEGNYVLAGDTASFGSGVRTSWIVKLSSDGNPLWERTYSRNAGDDLYSTRIVATEDGGLVASARIFQTGEGPIFKLDQDGAVDWARTNTEDTPSGRLGSFDIKTTEDGGVVMATGLNYWAAGDQYHEAYVWKLNARSDRDWRTRLKAIRPTGSYIDQDGMYSIEQTRDGGYITVGWLGKSSLSWNAQKACFLLYGHYCPDPPQYQGLWVTKIRPDGSPIWSSRFGTSVPSNAVVRHIPAGGLILLVQADDFLVLKLSDDGLPIWQYNYGGNAVDRGYDIKPTADGGFIAVGETGSYGRGGFDVFVIKIFADGSLEWAKTYGGSSTDQAFAVAPTADGGYLIAGKTNSFGVGAFDGWVLKLDAHGNVGENCNIDHTPIVTVQKIEVSRDELTLSFEISADNLNYTFLATEDAISEISYQCEVNR